jgi:hypothetical protein
MHPKANAAPMLLVAFGLALYVDNLAEAYVSAPKQLQHQFRLPSAETAVAQ